MARSRVKKRAARKSSVLPKSSRVSGLQRRLGSLSISMKEPTRIVQDQTDAALQQTEDEKNAWRQAWMQEMEDEEKSTKAMTRNGMIRSKTLEEILWAPDEDIDREEDFSSDDEPLVLEEDPYAYVRSLGLKLDPLSGIDP